MSEISDFSLLTSNFSLLYSPSTRGGGFTWRDPSKQGPPAEVLDATVPYPSLNRSKLTSFRQGTVLNGYYCGPLTQSNRCLSFPTLIADSRWLMADSKWQMADGRWRMAISRKVVDL